jgi:putative peptidoglycan lipid II flippase
VTNPARGRASAERSVARGAGASGAAILVSRVTGLVRDQVMAVVFGAGFATDAFNVAFRIPNLLRDLLAEGSMTRSLVRTFTDYDRNRGAEEAWELGRQLMLTLLIGITVLCAAGWVFSPQIVRLLAGGFEKVHETVDGYDKLGLTVLLTRVMLPFLPAVVLAAVAMGMLNARERYGVSQLASAVLNLSMVVVGLALIPVMRSFGQPAMLAMAVGVLVGGVLQFAYQLPPLHRLGFRLRWERPRWHPGVRRVALLMVPATVSSAGWQINTAVNTLIASQLQQGSVSWLYYALRLQQLPVGVLGASFGMVSLTKHAYAMVEDDLERFKETLESTLRLVIVATLPAVAWLVALSQPIVALLFEHGRFHAGDTTQTAGALVMYALGVPGAAGVNVMVGAFYALDAPWLAVQASVVSVGVNLALNLLFVGPLAFLGLGHRGLALASAVAVTINLLQLLVYIRRRVGRFGGRRVLDSFLRAGTASLLAGLAAAAGLHALGPRWHRGFAAEAGVVAAGSLGMLALTWGLMRLLRVRELATIQSLARGLVRRVTGR